MEAKEIIKAIKTFIKEHEEGEYGFMEIESFSKKTLSEDCPHEKKLFEAVGPFKIVENSLTRAGYDEPDKVVVVYHFLDHNVYLCIEGTYSSWVGSEWTKPWHEVFPETVSVVQYRKTKPKAKS